MNVKRTIALILALATLLPATLVFAPPASAYVGIRVNVAPPPLRHEVVIVRPSPRHVWVGGHWDWAPRRHEYVWVPGVWVRPHRAHAVWVAPRWERRGHESFFIRGHWRY